MKISKTILAGAWILPMIATLPQQAFGQPSSPSISSEVPDVAQKQCRSVHLLYHVPTKGNAGAHIRVVPKEVPEGTYFCALTFGEGYFGMQRLSNGQKAIIFSVWDPGVDAFDPAARPDQVGVDKQSKLVRSGEGVEISRFGGEGTGGKSMLKFDWKDGAEMEFLVTSRIEGGRQAVSGWFNDPVAGKWRLMSTWETRINPNRLDHLCSFVEDFRRDFESAKRVRQGLFGPVQVTKDGKVWSKAQSAQFSADGNPALTIDAGLDQSSGMFFLQTGGSTAMKTTQLWETIRNEGQQVQAPGEAAGQIVKQAIGQAGSAE